MPLFEQLFRVATANRLRGLMQAPIELNQFEGRHALTTGDVRNSLWRLALCAGGSMDRITCDRADASEMRIVRVRFVANHDARHILALLRTSSCEDGLLMASEQPDMVDALYDSCHIMRPCSVSISAVKRSPVNAPCAVW